MPGCGAILFCAAGTLPTGRPFPFPLKSKKGTSVDWSSYDGVETIPGKVSGVPLLKGTRVPADQVIESLDAGETVEEIAYNYDLKPADVLRLKRYRDSHQPALKR
jgi:uncharacterized protein (DUF433 family)